MSSQLESDLIGLLLTGKGERYFSVADRLKPEHFTDITLQAIYSALQRVHADQSTFSLSMVESRCNENPKDITLSSYLAMLKVQSPEGIDENDYADLIIDAWYKKTFVETAKTLQKLADNHELSGEELVEAGVAALVEPFDDQAGDNVFDMGKMATQILDAKSEKSSGGIYTGVDFFDRLAAPMQPGQLIVIGGATSSGKSSFVQMLSWKMEIAGIPTFTVTNEMNGKDTTSRVISQMSKVSLDRIVEPWTRNQDERERTESARDTLVRFGVKGMDGAKPTIGEITLKTKKYKRLFSVRVLIIDHLQFVSPNNHRDKRHEQLAQITSDLKGLAKDQEITVILVSHLTREDEWKPIKLAKDIRRPTLSRLFGSSSIEKDADVVMFVHRPYYFLERNPANSKQSHYYDWQSDMARWKGKAEIISAKRRQGKGVGVEEIAFDEETTLFHSLNVSPDQEELL